MHACFETGRGRCDAQVCFELMISEFKRREQRDNLHKFETFDSDPFSVGEELTCL